MIIVWAIRLARLIQPLPPAPSPKGEGGDINCLIRLKSWHDHSPLPFREEGLGGLGLYAVWPK